MLKVKSARLGIYRVNSNNLACRLIVAIGCNKVAKAASGPAAAEAETLGDLLTSGPKP